uniref:Baculoviral IAP repeat containing 5 n=1 Tax=Zosterops lateralis melanops TaxID=1220523 RepID=A0A8D2NIU6_ZOSLA
MWIPVTPSTRLRGGTCVLLLPCCLPLPSLPCAQCEVLIAHCVLCWGTVSGGFVSRQGGAPQLPNSALWNLSTSLLMAAAGFVHCPSENSPDVAQCFFCLKELEGWEPEDDPLEEHKKHSADCGFLSLQKEPANLTVQEFLKLDKMRMRKKKEISQKMTKVEDKAKIQRCSIKNLA